LFALNCGLRNGDAHLKNFGIVYDDVLREVHLAPAFDLVTTTVYMPKDNMALTLDGSTQWPSAKALQRLGETRAGGTPARVRSILERIADALSDVAIEVRQYTADHPEFSDVGKRLLEQWEVGRQTSGSTAAPQQ
jgi:serine/threonine-protein kinase HipA